MGIAKFCATLISAASIIALAEFGYGIWALIVGKLVNVTLQYVFLVFVSKVRLSFNIDRDNFKELVTFCLPLFWMVVLRFLNKKASNLFTGIVLGPVNFALLAAAHKAEVVINQVTMSSINSMVVPSFSRVAPDTDVGALFIRLVAITSVIVTPIFMGLAAIADPFVTIAFGEKFAPSAEYMTISAFSVFPLVIANFMPNLLISKAQTKAAFNITLVNIISNVIVAACTIWFGVSVMLICITVGNFLAMPIRFAIVRKHIFIDTKKLTFALLPSFLSALGMFLVVTFAKTHISNLLVNDVLTLIASVLLGGITYVLLSFSLFYNQTLKQVQELKSMFMKKRTNS